MKPTDSKYMRSRIIEIFLIIFLLLIGAGFMYRYSGKSTENCAFYLPDTARRSKGVCVTLERVETEEARIRGLSGRMSLPPTRGMLFVFDTTDRQCIWMKDMHFAIDILWLDESGKILEIKNNIKPETYPESFCAEGKYVIELSTGTADQAGLKNGQFLDL